MKNYIVIYNNETARYRIWHNALKEWVTNDWHLQRWSIGAYETRCKWLADRMAAKLEKRWAEFQLQSTWDKYNPNSKQP